jgi:hypothetical protein
MDLPKGSGKNFVDRTGDSEYSINQLLAKIQAGLGWYATRNFNPNNPNNPGARTTNANQISPIDYIAKKQLEDRVKTDAYIEAVSKGIEQKLGINRKQHR